MAVQQNKSSHDENNDKSERASARRTTTSPTSSSSSCGKCVSVSFLATMLFIPALCIVFQFVFFTETPPTDYGTGSMFDTIATRYDFINRALSLNLDTNWRKEMVNVVLDDLLPTQQQQQQAEEGDWKNNAEIRILDLATGTADVAILMAKEIQNRRSRRRHHQQQQIQQQRQQQQQPEKKEEDEELDNIPSSSSSTTVTTTTSTSTSTTPPPIILGIDPSQNMINIGRTKVHQQHLSDVIQLDIGDARNLRNIIQDNTFDGVTMAFGIRNVPERHVALCEIHRVLKKTSFRHDPEQQQQQQQHQHQHHQENEDTMKQQEIQSSIHTSRSIDMTSNSRLAILEFSEPDPHESGIMGGLARLFIRHIVPVVGAILSGAPKEYMHLQNSIKEFPTPKEFKNLMEGLECGPEGKGRFVVKEIRQLNFGSVQLYIATPTVKE